MKKSYNWNKFNKCTFCTWQKPFQQIKQEHKNKLYWRTKQMSMASNLPGQIISNKSQKKTNLIDDMQMGDGLVLGLNWQHRLCFVFCLLLKCCILNGIKTEFKKWSTFEEPKPRIPLFTSKKMYIKKFGISLNSLIWWMSYSVLTCF